MAILYAINGMKSKGRVCFEIDHCDELILRDRRFRYWKNCVWVYVYSPSGYKQIPLTHYMLGKPPLGFVIDHINGNSLDNRRVNLRPATPRQNTWNSRKKSNGVESRFKGVSRNGTGWTARIRVHGKTKCLGTFESPEMAAIAYERAAADLQGEFKRDAE